MSINEETERIRGFVDRENFHAAINLAISALNECRRNTDDSGIRHYMEVIKGIVETMEKRYLPDNG